MGFWGKVFHFLSTEDSPQPQARSKSNPGCVLCRHWVEPNAITTKIVPSQRAVDWAKSNGFGRCTAPASGDVEKKRFTKQTDGCDQHQLKTAGAR
ncbi:hypothetical protein ACFSM5_01230 [Lacibacterium aquatile]|uniref:Uncharacterized protein n=1 Tax=Lacibacterium aquatile TaxID=1168082 RepID=A0ABW5DQA5_9PROT